MVIGGEGTIPARKRYQYGGKEPFKAVTDLSTDTFILGTRDIHLGRVGTSISIQYGVIFQKQCSQGIKHHITPPISYGLVYPIPLLEPPTSSSRKSARIPPNREEKGIRKIERNGEREARMA